MDRMLEAASVVGNTKKFTFIPSYTVTSTIWNQIIKHQRKRLICGFPGISKSTSFLLLKRITDKICVSTLNKRKDQLG